MIVRRLQALCLPIAPYRQFFLLFILAILVLAAGIWEPSGITGKDEFFLGLRTPMEMMASDHWLVPFLDGAPRIRKPPMLYWLGRASYELFGASLTSARLIGVLFAALLVVATAGIGRRLSLLSHDEANANKIGRNAGLILLGCLGLHSEGRRFMLDVPVATLSALAFWCFLIWQQNTRRVWLFAAAVLLAIGFMVKGPIVGLLFAAGIAACLAVGRCHGALLRQQWVASLGAGLLFLALALPWFAVVRILYPEAVTLVVADEVESRRFFDLSPHIFASLFNIGLPWAFVFVAALWQSRQQNGLPRLLAIWFALSFLPFLLLKSFDRYLIGSLLPMAIFIAIALPELRARWAFRLGVLVTALLAGLIGLFAWRFELGGWGWLLLAITYLFWAWWQKRALAHTLAAPIVFAVALLWGTFPALGINAVPPAIVALGKSTAVAFYRGPQPAMLPILSGQPHRHYSNLDAASARQLATEQTPVFVEKSKTPFLQAELAALGWQTKLLGGYANLASHGSGLRLARPDAKFADWQAAWDRRSLQPLLTEVQYFVVVPQ